MIKKCRVCNIEKEHGRFYGTRAICISCVLDEAKAKRKELEATGHKRCIHCKKAKTLDCFYKSTTSKDGYKSICILCKHTLAQDSRELVKLTGIKTCTRCTKQLHPSNFSKDAVTPDGYTYWCKECVKETSRQHYNVHKLEITNQRRRRKELIPEESKTYAHEYYLKNKEKVLARSKTYRATPKGMFIRFKACAKQRKLSLSLTEEQFHSLMRSSCFVTNCARRVTGLDRIDSRKGYDLDNVRASCERHNEMLNNMSDKDAYRLAKEFVIWYESRHKFPTS